MTTTNATTGAIEYYSKMVCTGGPDSPAEAHGDEGADMGVIAGSTVGGVVAVVAVLALVIKRKRAASASVNAHETPKPACMRKTTLALPGSG